jgi:hypothetical protein
MSTTYGISAVTTGQNRALLPFDHGAVHERVIFTLLVHQYARKTGLASSRNEAETIENRGKNRQEARIADHPAGTWSRRVVAAVYSVSAS